MNIEDLYSMVLPSSQFDRPIQISRSPPPIVVPETIRGKKILIVRKN